MRGVSYVTLTAQEEPGGYTLDMSYTSDTTTTDSLCPVRTVRDGIVIHAAVEGQTGQLHGYTLCEMSLSLGVRCNNDRTPLSCPTCMRRARQWADGMLQDAGMFDEERMPCGCSSGSCYCESSNNPYDADYSFHHLGN